MTNIKMIKATIRGIGGEATIIKCVGTIVIKLESNDARFDSINIHDEAYVLSSPYKLLPPQLFITNSNPSGT